MQTEDAAPPASRQEIDPFLAHLPIAALVVRQARVVAANERTCALLGCRLAELLEAQDAIHAFVADGDGDRVFARHLSRIAGRPEPEEYDLDLRSRDGTRIPARARIAPFAPAGPGAFLVLLSDERARARSAELIRAFVDVAVSAQRETTRDGVFHLVRDRLAVAGLTLNVSAVKDGAFEVIALGAPPHAGILAMRERWPGGVPLDAFREVLPTPDSIHGSFIEDLPGLVARAVGKDRSELAPRMPPTAMFCYVPVDGATQYALSATGPGIDTTAASAFGLLGQHLGATLEMLRRLDELARSNGELALLLELGHDALGNLDLSRVLHAGARTAVRILRCSAAYIYLPDPNGTALQLAAVEDPETPTRTELGFTLPLGMPSLTGLAFSSREAQAAPNAETDERIHPSIVKRFGSHSVLSVPLLAHDVPRGVLTLMSRDERSFGPQDVRVAKHVAQLLSAAVAGTELFERERHRADELALVQELSGAISGKLDPAELLETAGARLLTLVEADLAAVYEQNGAAGELRLSWTRAKAGTAHALPARLAAPPVHGPATQLEEAVLRSASIRTPAGLQPLRRCGAVRLPGGRGVLGALCVARVTDNDFTPDELRILDAIGAQLSVAMENARLYAEQRARAEEMTLLNDVSRSFAGAIEMKPLLLAAGQTLRKLVGANNWFILLRDKSGKVLRAAACSPEHEEFMRRIELPLDQPSLSAQVVLQRRAIQAQQPLLAEIGSRRLIDYFHPCAVLAVPLIARDEVLGVVVLDDTERARVFSEAEMERTTGVCQQIALALLSARLY
ncbi:MAG TPA: GAF domain-containing protein, partial [Myxococcales bacterium]|nr:GAF domain-containing protein [Myxococcales bacterium]